MCSEGEREGMGIRLTLSWYTVWGVEKASRTPLSWRGGERACEQACVERSVGGRCAQTVLLKNLDANDIVVRRRCSPSVKASRVCVALGCSTPDRTHTHAPGGNRAVWLSMHCLRVRWCGMKRSVMVSTEKGLVVFARGNVSCVWRETLKW